MNYHGICTGLSSEINQIIMCSSQVFNFLFVGMYSIIVTINFTNVLHVTQKKAMRQIFLENLSLSNFDSMTLSDIKRRFDIEVDVGNNRNCRHSSTVCMAGLYA